MDTKHKKLESNQEKINESVQQNGSNRGKNKLYKKSWFWAVIVLSVIGAGLAIFAGMYLSAQSKNKQTISDAWFAITEKNKALGALGEKVDSQDSYNSYKVELAKLNVLIDEKKYGSQKLKYKSSDAKRYDNFLNEYSTYVVRAVEYSNKIEDYSEENNNKLKDLSVSAKSSSDDLKNSTKYLKENMPSSAFEIQNVLTEANKIILANQMTIKAQQLAQQAATAKDTADKKAAENTAGNFLNAFLAGNAPLLRQYMTEAYQKEYDFNQLTYAARAYTYPASFRILSNLKTEEGKYRDQANVLFKYRDGSGQYTVGYDMNIVFDSTSSKWLVNSIKEGSAF